MSRSSKELPGLDFVPFDDELGERIYNEISPAAGARTGEYSKRLINEYRPDLVTGSRSTCCTKVQEFLFSEAWAAEPVMYKPADSHGHIAPAARGCSQKRASRPMLPSGPTARGSA